MLFNEFQLLKIILIVFLVNSLGARKLSKLHPVKPPPPKYAGNSNMRQNFLFDLWTPESDSNIWENSGLFEGDIMIYEDEQRNGLINEQKRWKNGIVPFYIQEEDFNETQIAIILNGFKEYHERTCIRFRPYQITDENWIIITGNSGGCWSSVGAHNDGQVLNINAPKCVRHGVVLHELLHALGFYHQQSATERDEFVRINWENIIESHQHNFNKYNHSYVTNFNVSYDYASVMHYSEKAFSKNGKPTIESLHGNVTLGQRKTMTEKDVLKLNTMYKCNEKLPNNNQTDDDLLKFIMNFTAFYLKDFIK